MNEKLKAQVDELLTLAADMESFSPPCDRLSEGAEQYRDDELFEEDLSFVSAAGPGQSYASFRKKYSIK